MAVGPIIASPPAPLPRGRGETTSRWGETNESVRTIDIDDLNDLAVGATVLGTGGGGDPYIGRLMAAEAIRQYGPVMLIDPEELDPDALVLPVGMMGAPTVMVEKLPGGVELSRATEALEAAAWRILAKPVDITQVMQCIDEAMDQP